MLILNLWGGVFKEDYNYFARIQDNGAIELKPYAGNNVIYAYFDLKVTARNYFLEKGVDVKESGFKEAKKILTKQISEGTNMLEKLLTYNK